MWFFKPNVERLKKKRNIKGLIKALEHEDEQVYQAAINALGQIGDAQAVEPLIAFLWYSSDYTFEAAAKALGQLGDARAVEPLMACLLNRDGAVRIMAAEALERLGWQPSKDEAGACYWIMKREWNKCIAIGAPATHLRRDSLHLSPSRLIMPEER